MNSFYLAAFVLLVAYASGQPVSDSTNPSRRKKICGGCRQDATNDTKVVDLVKSTLLELDSKSDDSSIKHELKNMKATRQIVAGLLYSIKGTLVVTKCGKEDPTEVESCVELKMPKPEECEISILEQAWISMGRKTEVHCETKDFKFESEVPKMT